MERVWNVNPNPNIVNLTALRANIVTPTHAEIQ